MCSQNWGKRNQIFSISAGNHLAFPKGSVWRLCEVWPTSQPDFLIRTQCASVQHWQRVGIMCVEKNCVKCVLCVCVCVCVCVYAKCFTQLCTISKSSTNTQILLLSSIAVKDVYLWFTMRVIVNDLSLNWPCRGSLRTRVMLSSAECVLMAMCKEKYCFSTADPQERRACRDTLTTNDIEERTQQHAVCSNSITQCNTHTRLEMYCEW